MSPPVAPLDELFAAIFLGGSFLSDVVRAAERALLAGHDTPALRVIAGLEPDTGAFEMQQLGERLLHELGVAKPSRRALIEALARPMAQQFLERTLDAGRFVDRLYALSRQDRDDSGHHPWCQLQDDWTLAADGYGDPAAAHDAIRREAERLVAGGRARDP